MSKPNLLPNPQLRPNVAYQPTSYSQSTSVYKPSLYTPTNSQGTSQGNSSSTAPTGAKPLPNPKPVPQPVLRPTTSEPTQQPTQQTQYSVPQQTQLTSNPPTSYHNPNQVSRPSGYPTQQQGQYQAPTTGYGSYSTPNPSTTQRPNTPPMPSVHSMPSTPTTPPQPSFQPNFSTSGGMQLSGGMLLQQNTPQTQSYQPPQQQSAQQPQSSPLNAIQMQQHVQQQPIQQQATSSPAQTKRPSVNPMLNKGILPGIKNPTLKLPSLSGMNKPVAVEVPVAEEEPAEIFEYITYEWTAYQIDFLDADQLRFIPRLTPGTFPTPDIPQRPRDLVLVNDAYPKMGDNWVLKPRAEGIHLQHNYNAFPTSSNGPLSNRLTRSLSKSSRENSISGVNAASNPYYHADKDSTPTPDEDSPKDSAPQQPFANPSPHTSFRLSTHQQADSKSNLRVALTMQGSDGPPVEVVGGGQPTAPNVHQQRVSRAISPRNSASSGTAPSLPNATTTTTISGTGGAEAGADHRRSNPLNRNASSVRLGGAYQPQGYQPQAYKPQAYQAPPKDNATHSTEQGSVDQFTEPQQQQHYHVPQEEKKEEVITQPVTGFQASRPIHKKSTPRFEMGMHATDRSNK